ncbi:MAG: hypothetical protein HN580_17925 [Deltaproteobacteria bacterium]|nr:hypothetical protein [Deltaproteobacteria bacterium]MBT4263215.1 hypothetical protein [Deltaproteobacteria bacterium]MBT4640963.1 hypothetical protein [Deltaproteobacteria bacterium]MBT6611647.1 hypothetical protein [Deltaproteobacteria bacterium]MBT7156019.1 hypothetical protein [Deltaproteobacteria bacterium]
MIKRLFVMIVILLIVTGLSATVSARNKKRLANGYMVEASATSLVIELAKFLRGHTRLKKTGSGCVTEVIRYVELGADDKFYNFVVRKADQDGNRNGTAEYAELKTMWDIACTNRGK